MAKESGTVKTTVSSYMEETEKLRADHQSYFDAEGKPHALFYPKMAYIPKGKDELYVSFWPSELKKELDIYTEFVSRDTVPEDPNRSLWKYIYNPHWESEYEAVESPVGSNKYRYLVPVSELIKINKDIVSQRSAASMLHTYLTDEDMLVTELTVRDLLSIMTMKELSNKPWLNELISKARQDAR